MIRLSIDVICIEGFQLTKFMKKTQQPFEEAFDLIESISEYSGNMPTSLRSEIEEFLKKHSEQIYGIKNFLNK